MSAAARRTVLQERKSPRTRHDYDDAARKRVGSDAAPPRADCRERGGRNKHNEEQNDEEHGGSFVDGVFGAVALVAQPCGW